MTINTSVDVFQGQLWPQGDSRDPLGIWSVRFGVTGDASAGIIIVQFNVPAARKASYVYTCYSLNITKLTGTIPATFQCRSRLLTNWPDADALAGVRAYGSNFQGEISGSDEFPDIGTVLLRRLIADPERFLLLFDPRPQGTDDMSIVELAVNDNELAATYSFEGYGYFWDRSVLNAPGGPRHPGSS